MAETTLPLKSGAAQKAENKSGAGPLARIAKYTVIKIITLFATIVIAVYLTILIANMGGYVDEIRRGQIQEEINALVLSSPDLQRLEPAVRAQRLEEMVKLKEKRLGLDKPFAVRSVVFLVDALTLNLGRAENMTSDTGSRLVRLIILERLPSTLLLFATANLGLFFFSVYGALSLSRKYGSFLDKLIIALAPSSAAPGWFYGIFLILIFAAVLKVLPFGGMVSAPPPEARLAYILDLLKHMVLPVMALIISAIFQNIYAYRTFFLIYSSEDYVDVAKAKGLESKDIERRYIMRPTLPTIITNFALTLITMWTGGILLETVFNWPGLGRLIFKAIGQYDTPVIVGSTVIYAYLLAITVFLLDFVYALVDPRVKVGE